MNNGELGFEDIFSDNMVLPRNKAFHIAGFARSQAQVTVNIGQNCQSAQANSDGKWVVRFPAMHDELVSITAKSAEGQCSVQNVHFGQVHLLAGQSNIEYQLVDDQEYNQLVKQIKKQSAYFYNVPKVEYQNADGSVIPEDLARPQWQQVTPETIGELSAIGFYMLQQLLHDFPDQVIGIVDCYKGGTSASSWLPQSVLKADSELKATFIVPFEQQVTGKTAVDFKKELEAYQKKVEIHNVKLAAYLKKYPEATLSQAKDTVGHTPWPPPMTPKSFLRPGGLYETMVLTIRHYTFNDVVWYQGENDAPNPQVYPKLLEALILNWRDLLADRALPFYIVQLPGYADEPKDAWAMIRQAQLEIAQAVPDVHLISISDTGDEHNIHPASKRKPGTRIGQIISGLQYSDTPFVFKVEIHRERLILFVNHAATVRETGTTTMEVCITGKWYEKRVQLTGRNEITIAKSADENIESVRYAYRNYPKLTLYNEQDLPVAPFKIKLSL
ncbi:sialate O-acetylesterase [Pediococcus cellicola]|nr:sialate O-acetylesterase [Pediococcus cellicola]GEL15146.1 9-O-acetylesterase [Pediococcus cellicola]